MRASILPLAFLVAVVFAAAMSAAAIDPKALVVSQSDVPSGFLLDREASGVRTNEDEAKQEPRLAGLFRTWKRLTGYEARYKRGKAKIEARADLLSARVGARSMLDWYDREVRKAGLGGLGRVAGRVGDQAWIYGHELQMSVTIVVWRHGRVFSGVLGQGISRSRTLALARVQQARIAAALR